MNIYNPILIINAICILFHPLWCHIFYNKLNLNVIGLGIAYNLTSLLMLVMIYIYVLYNKLIYDTSIKEIKLKEFKIFLKSSFSCGILLSTDVLAFEALSILASYLPSLDQIDAHIVVVNIYNNIYAITTGFATAITILVGNLMGENKPKLAIKYSQIGLIINFSLTIFLSLICIIFHQYIALIYIKDSNIIKFSSNLIRIVGIFTIFDSLQLYLSGRIRGIGKVKDGVIISLPLFFICQTLLAWFLSFKMNNGVYGIWFSQIACGMIGCVLFYIFLFYFCNWIELAKKVSKKLDDEEEKVPETTSSMNESNILVNHKISESFSALNKKNILL